MGARVLLPLNRTGDRQKALDRLGLAVAIGLGLGFGLYQLTSMGFDGDAYWLAAERLRAGAPLYVDGLPNDPLVYRYPPWFAWAWVPLTYLPHELVVALWRTAMVGAALSIVPPLWRSPAGRMGLALFLPPLVSAGWMGNVQPLVVALCVYGAVGVAAGIKGLPILVAAQYVRRREWRRLALTVGIAGLLWATLLTVDLSGYPSVRGIWPTDLAVFLAWLRPTGSR